MLAPSKRAYHDERALAACPPVSVTRESAETLLADRTHFEWRGGTMPQTQVPFETRWWWRDETSGKVVCDLCPRQCRIKEGSRGFCFVRANVDGELVLTTYGRSSGFCVDPIEKKPLNHFLPGTPVMSLGTAGCNLGCKFCQNWDISKSRQMDTIASQAGPEAVVEAAKRAGCRSVAFTYNDPTIWAEYAIDIAKVARAEGIRTVAVTAGYISEEPRRELFQWMDAANIDFKAFTETFYRKLAKSHIQPVLDTLTYLRNETDVWFELTTLIIPGENDSDDEIRRMADWIVEHLGPDIPVHFTAFHPDFKMQDRPPTPHETLIRAREIALDTGIKFAYVGNVHDTERGSTSCPSCGTLLIERDWHELGAYRLDGNRCGACGEWIPGVFEPTPGRWGRRRMPVRVYDPSRAYVPATGSRLNKRLEDPNQEGTEEKGPDQAGTADVAPPAEKPGAQETSPKKPPTQEPSALTEDQADALVRCARSAVDAAVRGLPLSEEPPADLAEVPLLGVFVTLRRGGELRACTGRWGADEQGSLTIGSCLTGAARQAATGDARFPPIQPEELPHIQVEVSLLHEPAEIRGSGPERMKAIEVGSHGLVLAHPQGRGLLLPQVPVENGWDAQTFVTELARKAGLPAGAWAEDGARLLRFRARVLSQPAPEGELRPEDLHANRLHRLTVTAATGQLHGALHDPAMGRPLKQPAAVVLRSADGTTGASWGAGRPLLDHARTAGEALRKQSPAADGNPEITHLIAAVQPVPVRPDGDGRRFAPLAGHAVVGRWGERQILTLPTGKSALDAALQGLGLTMQQWQDGVGEPSLTALRPVVHSPGNRPGGGGTREPARVGQFYPASPDAMTAEVDKCLQAGAGAPMRRCRGVLLPHAGWRFCGPVIGKTLARVRVPSLAVVIGPKHTPHGANWSVAPQEAWRLPGDTVPVATELVFRLVELVPGLSCEVGAHQAEHGTEVLLPFLRRVNPNLRVVPITIGTCSEAGAAAIGRGLATLFREPWLTGGEQPLLVISSDMHHFASDAVGRQLDHMALEALSSGDPSRLFRTCQRNSITMCGMRPAAAVLRALGEVGGGVRPEVVDYANTATVTGDPSSVVGYAGAVID